MPVKPKTTTDWFDLGAQAFASGGQIAPAQLPPLGEPEAQRWWLGGFGAAWADAGPPATLDHGHGPERTAIPEPSPSILDALVLALDGRPALLAELWQHGAAGLVGPRH
jgi:hypothetical protein